jgi:hypothetical protein
MTFQPTYTECTDPSCYWCNGLPDAAARLKAQIEAARRAVAEADLASARAENERLDVAEGAARLDALHWKGRAESAEARVRDLEAKIVAIEAWGRRWLAAGHSAIGVSHARWSAFEALLGKEQPNG